ncbi:ABC-three component system middle component 8 [Vreelandella boliviensis]|uniref:Uncharacterized protein n=1 Tax=Vreelandella boliviensis LC1 TaxID=1072583 RepID=A0ABX4G6S8_9GAMM|nr:hypothetical protein CE457_14405 [Halomonas boliviensis LC1]
MLRPTKHSHPDQTVINAALVILVRLRKVRIDSYSDLLSYAKKSIKGGEFLFLPALNFLFLTGVVEYRKKTDSIEFIVDNDSI